MQPLQRPLQASALPNSGWSVRSSGPLEAEINRLAALAQSLGFVARARPSLERAPPVVRARRRPTPLRGAQDAGERPAGVVVDVGGEEKVSPRLHDPRQGGETGVGHEAALALAPLWPGIGVEEVHPMERGRG